MVLPGSFFRTNKISIIIKWIYSSFSQYTARKLPKYRAFSGPYFSVFGLNTGKYGPEKTPYLDTFHAAIIHFYGISLLLSKVKDSLRIPSCTPLLYCYISHVQVICNKREITFAIWWNSINMKCPR